MFIQQSNTDILSEHFSSETQLFAAIIKDANLMKKHFQKVQAMTNYFISSSSLHSSWRKRYVVKPLI